MITWDAVSVEYGVSPVLGPVSLSVEPGEWMGIIGPNGAGKSTMLKVPVGIVGFEGAVRGTSGELRPGLDVAWMPQRPHMPNEMSVADYVLLGRTPHLGYISGESKHDLDAVASALGRLGLSAFTGRPLGTLSGGEAQRVLLARALSQEAPLLLLDEPTASLDIGHAVEVLEAIDELRREQGLTVVSAEHDLSLAGRYADRLALLSAGTIHAIGGATEVLTEEVLQAHYGTNLRVVPHEEGPVVVPSRPNR